MNEHLEIKRMFMDSFQSAAEGSSLLKEYEFEFHIETYFPHDRPQRLEITLRGRPVTADKSNIGFRGELDPNGPQDRLASELGTEAAWRLMKLIRKSEVSE